MHRIMSCLVLLAGTFAGNLALRGDDSFGTIRLQLERVGDETVKPDTSPRLAVLLVDCSSSMTNAVRSGSVSATNPQRLHAVLDGLRACLEQLAKDSPGIEVRVRFFNERLDCIPQVSVRLGDVSSVEAVMKRVPREPKLAPGTHLYESTCKIVDEMLAEHQRRGFGWMFFGVFSDGEDQKSPAPYSVTAHKDRIRAFQEAGPGFSTVVWPVGPEAEKLASGGSAYGPTTIVKLGDAIPKPPPPRPRYALVPAPDQGTDLSFKRLAQHGKATVALDVSGPGDVLAALNTSLRLNEAAPYRLETDKVGRFAAGPVTVSLDLPAEVNVADGVATTLVIEGSAVGDLPFLIEGDPAFTFTFLATKTLRPEQWAATLPPAVQRGSPARCSVNPGEITQSTWTFAGPKGQALEETGLAVAPVLPTGGTWRVSFGGVSDTGDAMRKDLGEIEVIDADFAFDPAATAVKAGDPANVRIAPVPDAAEATFHATLDGESLVVAFPDVTIPADRLDTVGRHVLTVTAKSTVGGFEWTHDATVDALFAPRIEILSGDYHEGAKEAVASVHVAGDVGDAVMIRVDDREPSRMPVIFEDPAKTNRSAQIRVTVPADSIGRSFSLEVSPAKPGACPPAQTRIEGRPADISCRLVSPLDGSGIAITTPPPIEIEPAGDDRDDVGDVNFIIGFRRGGDEGAVKDGPTATRAAGWRVALAPDLMPGSIEVHARPIGGRLQPDAFPQGKSWRQVGTLHVAPQMLWISVVGADPPSGPPIAIGESAAIGPVRPGRQTTLELRDVPKGNLAGVRWTMGPLPGDPQFEQPLEKSGGQDVLVLDITPKAVGVLPLKADLRMEGGVAVPPALASLVVEARRIQPTPELETAGTGAAARSPKRHAAAPGAASTKSRPFSASGDILFHPGIDGDFLDATVAVFEKHSPADAPPLWSQTFQQDTESIRIPYAALPQVDAGQCRRDLEIRMTIRPYPGYPFPGPSIPPVPFSLLATKHWGWFWLLAPLISAAMWWLGRAFVGHHLSAATLHFDVDPLPAPKEMMRSLTAGKLRINGRDVTDKAFPTLKSPFLPWRLFGRREARIPLELLARILARKSELTPRLEWILKKPQRANHTLFVTGLWQSPFQHLGEGGGTVSRVPPKGWLGVDFNSTVWRERDGGDERVSETQKIWVPGDDDPTDTLYYRLHWSRFHDPFARWRWALLAPWFLSLATLAWLCNLFCPS